MKKSLMLVLSFALALWFSGMTQAAAAQGKGQGGGKPASTGLEHAEANPKGVEHGIENAESKQGKEDTDASKPNKGKAKGKKHRHSKKNSNAASH